MKLSKLEPKFVEKHNPRIGLITLASDFRIEKDFNNLIYDKDVDLYSNRINSYNPLTNETLKKMADDIPKITQNILPNQKLDFGDEPEKEIHFEPDFEIPLPPEDDDK